MSSRKKFFTVCGIIAAAGLLICIVGFAMGGAVTGVSLDSDGIQVYRMGEDEENGDFKKGAKTIDSFERIEVNLEYTDVKIEVSDHYGIEYRVNSKSQFSYEVKDGCLTVKETYKSGLLKGQFHWFMFGSDGNFLNSEREYVKIYVPEKTRLRKAVVSAESGNVGWKEADAYSLELKSEYGDISVEDAESQNMNILLESGNIKMESVAAGDMQVKCEYGDGTFQNVKADGQIELDMDSGDLELRSVKAQKLICGSEYGDIKGTEAAADGVELKLESGDCSINDLKAEKIQIESEYGDVNLGLREKVTAYGYDLYTDYGDITINGRDMGDTYDTMLEEEIGRSILVRCDSGDIVIE